MKVFIVHSVRDRELVTSVVNLLREDGQEVFVSAELAVTGNFLSEISAAIRSADVLVAVVTAGNPNVFYELGLAVGASVPTLITAHAGEVIPADLASIPYVQLTDDLLRDAQTIVRRAKDLEGLSLTRAARFTSAEAALRAATRDPAVLEALGPAEFERLVVELFRERGYEVATTPATRDAGVDLVITSQRDKKVVLVEVKKLSRQSRVSVEAVRKLLGAVSLMSAPLGMLQATSGFTAAALALAAGTPIVLRTLEEVLAAKSESELLATKQSGG